MYGGFLFFLFAELRKRGQTGTILYITCILNEQHSLTDNAATAISSSPTTPES